MKAKRIRSGRPLCRPVFDAGTTVGTEADRYGTLDCTGGQAASGTPLGLKPAALEDHR